MAENKTKPTSDSVRDFLASVDHDVRRTDSQAVLEIMESIATEPAAMWGKTIVGFGQYHYKYDSGREGDFFRIGFSPRKQALTVYIVPGFSKYDDLLAKLGKHKTGRSCLYINKLADVDIKVLTQLIKLSYEHMAKKYPESNT